MKCHEAQQYLGSYALGEVDGWARGALESHLESCEFCRAELGELHGVIGQIYEAAGGQAPKALPPLPDRVGPPSPTASASRSWPVGRVVLVAAGLMLLGLAAGWVWTRIQQQSDASSDVQPFGRSELTSQIASESRSSRELARGVDLPGGEDSKVSESVMTLDLDPSSVRHEAEKKARDAAWQSALKEMMDLSESPQDALGLVPQQEELQRRFVRAQVAAVEQQLLSADEVYAITDAPATRELEALGYLGTNPGRFAYSAVRDGANQLPRSMEVTGDKGSLLGRGSEGGRQVLARDAQVRLKVLKQTLGLAKTQDTTTLLGDEEEARRISLSAALDGPATEGTLKAQRPGGEVLGQFPLEHTDVDAEISGFLARTRVLQRFGNPYTEAIEAVYVFPLPTNAAINGFVMQVGDRKIVGIVRPREEAEQIYAAAKARGQTASLLTQERTNIFTQSVANIEPGGTVDIDITYFHTLDYQDGEYEYLFPMVVGPRYIPGSPRAVSDATGPADPDVVAEPSIEGNSGSGTSPNTDQVADASRITPPVLKEGERSGHDISLRVRIDAGVLLSDVTSPTHDIDVEPVAAEKAKVELASHDAIPNRDFVLRYRVTGPQLQLGLLTHRTQKLGGFFSLMLVPQLSPADADVTPREITFVIDNSGSMNGTPIQLCKDMVKRTLESLRPQDRFNIIQFAGSAGQLAQKSLENSPENVQRGLSYVETLKGAGGTEMLKGVRAFLDTPADENHIQMVCFLTDGYIGNEDAILSLIKSHGQHARWYAFGVGSSVNRMLIEGIAQEGRGQSMVLLPNDPEAAKDASNQFFGFMDSPVLTDIAFDWSGLPVTDVYPSNPRDLFAGQPIVIVGRYDGAAEGQLVVKGQAGVRDVSLVLPVRLPELAESHAALAPVWARSKIADLSRGLLGQPEDPEAIRTEIRDLAVDFQLVSQYTAFVAVDESRIVGNGRPLKILQPVEVPAFVNRATAVGNERVGTARRIDAWGVTLYLDASGEISVAALDEGLELQRQADVSLGEVLCALNGIELRGFTHFESLLLQASGSTVELSFRPAGQPTAPRRTVTVARP